jgi:hypothetical protein
MPNHHLKTGLTVRQTKNEIFTDRILSFGKGVRIDLTRRQMRNKSGRCVQLKNKFIKLVDIM